MTADRTRARPFAKAVFELANETKQVDAWRSTLAFLGTCVETAETRSRLLRLHDARSTIEFLRRFGKEYLPKSAEAFIATLVRNHAILVLPRIRDMFEELVYANQGESILELKIAVQASPDSEAKLIKNLERNFGLKLTPRIHIDPSIQGGYWARVGDRVIDASVRGAMEKLTRAVAN